MKNYPRIYSLSTLGLIHHYENDYLFHNMRTDFVGDSGSGKSIIADLLQLIFVGSEMFESATRTMDEKMAEIRLLNRAKWRLMEREKMSEKEAHRYIEKRAMDRCISKTAVAREILRSNNEK